MDLLVFLLITLAVVSLETYIYHRCSMNNISYNCHFETEEAYEGDEIILVEEITNAKLLPIPWLKSEITTSKWLEFAELQSVVADDTRFVSSFFMLKSYHKIVRRWKVKCIKRGIFGIEKTVLVATDLFGTVNVSMPVEINSSVRVLPVPIDTEAIIPSSLHLYGDRVVRRQLVTDPFYYNGVREYSEADGAHKINWPASAKQNEIMVFANEYTSDRNIALIMNIQSRETDRKSISNMHIIENCIKLCATVADECSRDDIPLSFYSNAASDDENTSESCEGRGHEHTMDIFRILAGLPMNCAEGFDKYLFDTALQISSSEIYIVTPYVNDAIIRFASLKSNARVLVVGGSSSHNMENISYVGGIFTCREAE